MTAPINLEQCLCEVQSRWRAGELNDACFAGLSFFFWRLHERGARFAARTRKNVPKPDVSHWLERAAADRDEILRQCLVNWFENYHFVGTRQCVGQALVGWLRDGWSLVACDRVPLARQVLRLLCRGVRPVTIVCDPALMNTPIAGKANPHAFLLHDLEHGYRLFHDPMQHRLQVGMARVLEAAIRQDIFSEYVDGGVFDRAFDYLIGDMNTHPMHSLGYLRAIVLERLLTEEKKAKCEPLSPSGRRRLETLFDRLAQTGGFCTAGFQSMRHIARGEADSEAVGVIASNLLEIASRPVKVSEDSDSNARIQSNVNDGVQELITVTS